MTRPLLSVLLALLLPRPAAATAAIKIDAACAAIVAELPPEMSGAGCGIEYLNHEIDGGLYSQLILDESFEYSFNASTGLTDQWLAGAGRGSGSSAMLMTRQGSAALNGRQYVQLATGGSGAGVEAWAENRGVNRWGLNWQDSRNYEGSLWLSNPAKNTASTVRVALACGASNLTTGSTLAEARIAVPHNSSWREFHFNLTAAGRCSPERSGFLIELLAPAAADLESVVNVDFVTVHPGEWGRYHGLPVKKDLATMLIHQMAPTILRFGGGTINARRIGDDDPKNYSGWGLGYSWKHMRGPRWQRPPMQFVNPHIKETRDQISYASNGCKSPLRNHSWVNQARMAWINQAPGNCLKGCL